MLTRIALIVMPLVGFAHASRQLVLVDRSGSMKPYYLAGAAKGIARLMVDVSSDAGPTSVALFSTEILEIQSVDDPRFAYETDPWSFTKIDLAAEYATNQRFDIAWLLTDNIQHYPGDPEGANLEKFYDRLKADAVRAVELLPILQQPGLQGLTVYALLLNDREADAFYKEVSVFQEKATSAGYRTEALRIKPLDKSTVEVEYPEGPLKLRKCSLGERLTGKLPIVFRSKFKHLGLKNALVTCNPPVASRMATGAAMETERASYTVTPSDVPDLPPGGRTQRQYTFDFDLGRMRLKKGLGPLLMAATTSRHEKLDFELPVRLEVSRSDLSLAQDFRDKYHASTPDSARKYGTIFGVGDIPIQLSEATLRCSTAVTVPVDADYGYGPAAILVFIILAIVAVVVVTARMLVPAFVRWREGRGVHLYAVAGDVEKECTIRGERRTVFMDYEELGRIGSDHCFWPAEGHGLEGSVDRVKVRPGLKVQLTRTDGRSLLLLGRRPGKGSPPSSEEPAEPPARREETSSNKPIRR